MMKKLGLLALMLMLSVVTVACMKPTAETEEDVMLNEENAMETGGEEAVADEIFQQIQAEIQAAAEANNGEAQLENVAQTAINSEAFPTLVAALQAANLVNAVATTQDITVFAPTEEAFAALLVDLDMTAEELLADTELLTKVLTYHVVPGVYTAADVMGLTEATDFMTLQGSNVSISEKADAYLVNESKIVQTDIMASNGIIHAIDKVLVPKN